MGLSEIISRINWVDVLILTLLFRISYVGFYRGLLSEIIPFIGIFTALIIGLHYYLVVGNFIAAHTPLSSVYASLITFIALILIIRYIFRLIESLIIGKIVTVHIASFYDRLGGLIVGALRGILLISALLIALEIIPFEYIDYSINEKSIMAKRFLKIGYSLYQRTAIFLKD